MLNENIKNLVMQSVIENLQTSLSKQKNNVEVPKSTENYCLYVCMKHILVKDYRMMNSALQFVQTKMQSKSSIST